LTVIIFVSIFPGCISPQSETSIPTVVPTVVPTVIPTVIPTVEPQQDGASTSSFINWESSAENITIYVPVFLDENKNILKMYDSPVITGNVTTAIVDTEHGKALKISKSGSGNFLFNWNEISGKDTDHFVKWIEKMGWTQPGEELDITKTDNGKTITVSGRMTLSGRNILIVRLNEENILDFYNMFDNITQKWEGAGLFFAKEEKENLNIYSGNNEINMNESHEKLKADEFDEFFRRFTISLSNYELPEHFINMPLSESDPKIDAWVYSDTEIEKFSLYFSIDPKTSLYESEGFSSEITLIISPQGWVHLKKGWQVVNLSLIKGFWDAVPAPTT
jgi:hypothetical protein